MSIVQAIMEVSSPVPRRALVRNEQRFFVSGFQEVSNPRQTPDVNAFMV